MLESLIVLLSPVVVSFATQMWKKLPAFDLLTPGWHKTMLRISALVLSSIAASLTAYVSGQPVDMSSIAQLVSTVLYFLGSQGLYFLMKQKKSQ